MKGRVLSYSVQENAGVISGDDGRRYTFEGPQWREQDLPVQGAHVDFQVAADTDEAVSIYLIREGVPTPALGEKNKVVAGILAILFGVLGAHKFYLGYSGQGALLLVLFILGIPLMFLFGVGIIVWVVIGIITLVEGIIYLTKPDAEFEETYVKGRKAWF